MCRHDQFDGIGDPLVQPFLPLQQGFDEYLGLPYSNDMWPVDFDGVPLEKGTHHKAGHPVLRFIEGNEIGEAVRTLADKAQLTKRYTERALRFIGAVTAWLRFRMRFRP